MPSTAPTAAPLGSTGHEITDGRQRAGEVRLDAELLDRIAAAIGQSGAGSGPVAARPEGDAGLPA